MAPSPNSTDSSRPFRRKKREGATSLEYLFVTSLIIVVAIASIQFFGSKAKGLFEYSEERLSTTVDKD